MTHDQAACELGWPVGTVRGRLARARALLAPVWTAVGSPIPRVSGRRDHNLSRYPPISPPAWWMRPCGGRRVRGDRRFDQTTALAVEAVLRSLGLVALARSSVPLLLFALIAGTAAIFEYAGGGAFSVQTDRHR